MNRVKLIFVVILMVCICCKEANAEEQPLFKSFDIRTESTRPKVLKILVDRNGLVWTGTDNGVFTFDGINFSKINNSETVSTGVSAFFEDKNGKIWVGYENGKIAIIENYEFKRFNPEEGIPKNCISSISEDNNGHICFSTKGEGIYFYDRRLYNVNTDDGLNDDYCYSMVKLPDGRMCIGTDAGLNFVTFLNGKKSVTTIGPSEGLPDEIVRTLSIDKNILWIGMQDNGIAQYDCIQRKLVPVNIKTPWEYGPVSRLMVVEKELWITTESKGIFILNKKGEFHPVTLTLQNTIKASDIAIDHENNIWIAESLHLLRTTGRKLTFIDKIEGKDLKFVHCILFDKSGNLWFTPDQQLGKLSFNENGKYKFTTYNIVRKADIVTLYFDPYGYLWIGTLGEGVFRFNPKTGVARKVTARKDTESSSILSINGTGNTVWVGGFNSVNKYVIESNGNSDDAKIVRVPVFAGSELLNDYVYSVFIDSKGITWFGTDGSGIYKLEESKLTNIPISENAIHGFTEDKKGRIWFTTADAGIGYIGMKNEVHPFHTKDGLSDPTPTAFICMENGNLLVAHANGFDILDPESKTIIYHSSEENLDNINGDLNSITIAPDKSIWMGIEGGILHYRPESDVKLQYPEVKLRSLSVFLNPVDLKTRNEFSADENNFSFDYAALWYTDPQRLNYLFLLEGYSAKWEKTKDHSITFPKLPPSKYLFRIRASINDDFSHSKETTYAFVIQPPYWQRWWFRIAISTAIALIILTIVKRREKRLRNFDRLEKDKIKFQFETLKSQVNPHFLFNSFNTLISVIEDKPELAVEYVEKLSEFFRNIVNYRDKNLVPLNEELGLLDNYIFIQRKRYGENLKLEITLDENTKNEKCVPPLTLQMLAENAIKHNAVSKETPLIISITVQDNKLSFKNNLNKKIAKESSAGFGLENIKSRYNLLTTESIEIINDEYTFQVFIPLLEIEHEHTHT